MRIEEQFEESEVSDMERITVSDILKHGPCKNWTEEMIRAKIGNGKTLLQILQMRSVPVQDRIWCVERFLTDEENRAFAIWCARQCKTNISEIKTYIDVIERFYNGDATQEELSAADRAAYREAYSAAYWAADRAKMRKKQVQKLREILKAR